MGSLCICCLLFLLLLMICTNAAIRIITMICCRVFIMNHVFSTIGAGIILFEPSKNALFVKKVTTVPGKAHGVSFSFSVF